VGCNSASPEGRMTVDSSFLKDMTKYEELTEAIIDNFQQAVKTGRLHTIKIDSNDTNYFVPFMLSKKDDPRLETRDMLNNGQQAISIRPDTVIKFEFKYFSDGDSVYKHEVVYNPYNKEIKDAGIEGLSQTPIKPAWEYVISRYNPN
jgi:hypothetical protein